MNGKNLTCLGLHPTLNQTVSVELDVQCKFSLLARSPLPPPPCAGRAHERRGRTSAGRDGQIWITKSKVNGGRLAN